MAINITLRRVKGSILTEDEMDDNLVALKDGAQQGIDDAAEKLSITQNLGDLDDATEARDNLGLGSIATSNLTISTSDPSGSAQEGDIWLKVS